MRANMCTCMYGITVTITTIEHNYMLLLASLPPYHGSGQHTELSNCVNAGKLEEGFKMMHWAAHSHHLGKVLYALWSGCITGHVVNPRPIIETSTARVANTSYIYV